MCGRLACYLSGEALCTTCSYKKNDVVVKPYCNIASSSLYYVQSYNIYPTSHVPILISTELLPEDFESDLAIMSMRWGLVPPWVNLKDSTVRPNHNARSDNLQASSIFRPEIENYHRCVVLCNGYYEWKVEGRERQPYYLYNEENNANECIGEPLLKLAAIFSINKKSGDYSCAVITQDAHSKLSWLHHRMPVMLNTTEEVEKWIYKDKLDVNGTYDFLKDYEATQKIENHSNFNLKSHPVGKDSLRTSNKDSKCIERVALKRKNTLDNWVMKKP